MLNQKTTILLLGLMCFSSVSGFYTVICLGSDGHIKVEAATHNHCPCPESGEIANQVVRPAIAPSISHGHCKDTLLISNYVLPARKNIKLSLHNVFTAHFFLKSISLQTTSTFGHMAVRSNELSSFFAPLRTVILLA